MYRTAIARRTLYLYFPIVGLDPVDHIRDADAASFFIYIETFAIVAYHNMNKIVLRCDGKVDIFSARMFHNIVKLFLDHPVGVQF